jgi:hypothetical protein
MREDLLDGDALFELLEIDLVRVHARLLHYYCSSGQAVLAVVWHDVAFPARLANGQLRGALGRCGALDEMVAQLTVARSLAEVGQSLGYILGFYLVAQGIGSHRWAGGGKPQRMRLQV